MRVTGERLLEEVANEVEFVDFLFLAHVEELLCGLVWALMFGELHYEVENLELHQELEEVAYLEAFRRFFVSVLFEVHADYVVHIH